MLGHVEQSQQSKPTDVVRLPETLGGKPAAGLASRRKYEKRKAAGLCAYLGCPSAAATLHRYCCKHLHAMAEQQRRRVKKRKEAGLCAYCGTGRRFWGVRCIMCRQKSFKDPLPPGARKALRFYREAEREFELELRQARARFEIRKLLASGDLTGDYARALRLYAGTDVSSWRTYKEVGRLMRLSRERVRQLLKPSKITLANKLADNAPWRPVRRGDGGNKFPSRAYRRKPKPPQCVASPKPNWKASASKVITQRESA